MATQAIEAGVDISATTLLTELAPWASLVQRFGRCNRRGLCGADGRPSAQVFWIDIDTNDAKNSPKFSLPYTPEELGQAREYLKRLQDVGVSLLAAIEHREPLRPVHTLRRKDLVELWDTTPDLSGNDLDVSRYIRDADDTDIQFYWREGPWGGDTPPKPKDEAGEIVFPRPVREELCAVSIGQARTFVGKLKEQHAWHWDPLVRSWVKANKGSVRPGMTLLLHVSAGGYRDSLGWTGNPKHRPTPHPPAPEQAEAPDANEEDQSGSFVTLARHLANVANEVQHLRAELRDTIDETLWDAVATAARWHDVGKAHLAFQTAILEHCEDQQQRSQELWAKSPSNHWLRYCVKAASGTQIPGRRIGFRHELASVLAWLAHHSDHSQADLIAFLIAAHHGKVRGSIRSLPNEQPPPDPTRRFARGIWDGDDLPSVDLGEGEKTDPLTLSLQLMELGESDAGPSWLSRVLAVRDRHGPFRLAYLETLLRMADWAASRKEK